MVDDMEVNRVADMVAEKEWKKLPTWSWTWWLTSELQKAADISLLFFSAGAMPFWVLFGPFRQFWVIFGPIWAILGHFGPFFVLIFCGKILLCAI